MIFWKKWTPFNIWNKLFVEINHDEIQKKNGEMYFTGFLFILIGIVSKRSDRTR